MHNLSAILHPVKQKLNDASVQNRFRAKLLALWPALKGSLAEVRKPCIRPHCPVCARGDKHPNYLLAFTDQVLPEFSGRSLLAKPTSLAAPIRAGLASPLRVATGGAANCGSGVRPRRSPAPANTRRAVGSGRDWQRGLQKQA